MPDPHHRITAAQKALKSGKEITDTKIRELAAALKNAKNAKPALKYALSKFLVPYERTVMDALFLGGATPDEVFEATEIPPDAIQAYGDYIFDRTVFRDRLERITWVKQMTEVIKPSEAQILMTVMSVGVRYLVWYLTGRGKYTPAEVLRFSMNDAFMRGMGASRVAPLDSEAGREAHNWIRTAERLAKTVHQVDPQENEEAQKQLLIALNHRDDTGNEQTTGIPAEKILH